MKVRSLILLIIALCLGSQLCSQQQDCPELEPDKFRILFVLDASYSMEAKWENTTLWDIAKKTVVEFAYYLQKNYHVEMGLRVYGHNSPISLNDCQDSKLEVPIQPNSAAAIQERLRKIKYKGSTPLTYSLEQATEDLGCNNKKNIIILITDGFESCNRNPCAAALKMLNYRIAVKPLVIGLNLDYRDIEQLKCIGDFKNTTSAKEFKKTLFKSFTDIASKKSVSIFLQNPANPKSESLETFSIFDSKTKKPLISYYHTISSNGMPDTFVLAQGDTIDVLIHSIPPVWKRSIALQDYVHNQVNVPFPIGKIETNWNQKILQKAFINPDIFIYRGGKLIDKVPFQSKQQIVNGTYDLILSTIPQIKFSNYTIQAGDKKKILLDAPGYLYLVKAAKVYADLYAYQGNKLSKCYTISPTSISERLFILPGKYKIIYRSTKSFSIHGTFEKSFEIKPNEIVNIQL